MNLVNQYNILVEQARKLGLRQYRTTQRFRPASSGPERIAQIEQDIRAAQAGEPAEQREPVATVAVMEVPVAEVVEAEAPIAEVEAETQTITAAVEEAIQQEDDNPMAKQTKTKKTKPKTVKAAKTASTKRGRPPSNGVTIAVKTQEYNDLVPQAKKKGVTWAKVHSSYFGSHTAADAQIKKLQDAIKNA